ncbi:trigger factor [Ehrlichia ruminantium]|uniref:Trigger factor n=1 Tax=Ehrlichia ruminantium TaxID=779 RepID=A0AAE6QAG6_EHRRU|nr:trigger factor [Ehrlichia ruminantium]QGR03203.1 trigger factor [Ehrlichia ruminantium]QGR04128.1 trigger factor [Ehrlichia ruminantium]
MLNNYVVKEILSDKLKREYEFVIDNEYFFNQLDTKLSEIAKNVKIPGFRAGKVSVDLIKKEYLNDAVSSLIRKIIENTSSDFIKNGKFGEIISSNISVISCPDCGVDADNKSNNMGKDSLVYKLSFEVMPEAPLLVLDDIVLSDIEVNIQDSDIDEFIEDLKKQCSDFVEVSDLGYEIQNGDKVVVDYQNKIRGKMLKGGDIKDLTVVIGSGAVLKDFEDQLIGMKIGETKNFPIRFPDNYAVMHLAGKNADVSVTVKSIFMAKAVEDNESVVKYYNFTNEEALKDFAKNKIKQQCDKISFAVVKKELFDYMDKTYSIDVPECVVNQEIEKINQEIQDNPEKEQIDVTAEAVRRVKLGILLVKMSRHNSISVNKDDILSFINTYYSDYGISLNAVLKMLRSNKDFANYISGKVLEDKVINYIIRLVKKDKKVMTTQELDLVLENM